MYNTIKQYNNDISNNSGVYRRQVVNTRVEGLYLVIHEYMGALDVVLIQQFEVRGRQQVDKMAQIRGSILGVRRGNMKHTRGLHERIGSILAVYTREQVAYQGFTRENRKHSRCYTREQVAYQRFTRENRKHSRCYTREQGGILFSAYNQVWQHIEGNKQYQI